MPYAVAGPLAHAEPAREHAAAECQDSPAAAWSVHLPPRVDEEQFRSPIRGRRLASPQAPMPLLYRRDITLQIDTAQELCEGGFTARTTCELVTTSVQLVWI